MKPFPLSLPRCAFFLFGLLAAAVARPQAPDPTLVVVGTSIRSPLDNSPWAYLSWLATRPELLRDRPYAVYVKDGGEDSLEPYRLVGTARPQVDAAAIGALFDRSRHLGQDLAKLGDAVGAYFGELQPDVAVPVADMMAALAMRSFEEDNVFQMLVFMGRTHPGVALALGTGFAVRIPEGESTFELREASVDRDGFGAVIGRISVTAGQALSLEPPGAPVSVPNTDRDGQAVSAGHITHHMNVKLRWPTPELLRRQVLLLRGYNVIRVGKVFAESRGWQNCPPELGLGVIDWDAEIAAHFPQVARVNRLPILPRRFYTTAEAVDFDLDAGDGVDGDLNFYTQDDNRHNGLELDEFGEGIDANATFVPGAEFYYFVVAEDLLGRLGHTSCATLIKICDRDPPIAPKAPKVTNDFVYDDATQSSDQRLRVTWPQLGPREGALAYYVFRWRSLEDLKAQANVDPLSLGAEYRVAGPIPHTGGDPLTVVDNQDPTHSPGIGADPQFGAPGEDAGMTIWYTVVAVDDSECGGNASAHSAPGDGVLRDRAAPLGGGGLITIRCCGPALAANNDHVTGAAPVALDPNRLHFQLSVTRGGDQPEKLVAMDFWLADIKNEINYPLLFQAFPAEATLGMSVQASLPRDGLLPDGTYYLKAQVVQDDGRRSGEVLVGEVQLLASFLHQGSYAATRTCGRQPQRQDIEACRTHEATAPDGESIEPIDLELQFPIGIRQWRLYRSVSDGPLSMIRQGVLAAPSTLGEVITLQDYLFLAGGGEACYFVQYFDEHSNGGPMKDLGCIALNGFPPPTPVLARISPLEQNGEKKAKLRWFCPVPPVQHFEILIGREGGPPPADIANGLTQIGTASLTVTDDEGNTYDLVGRRYESGVVGHTLPHDGPEFTLVLDKIDVDVRYHIAVVAVGKTGLKSPLSNIADFRWTTPASVVLPEVAWPARPAPDVIQPIDWDSRIVAEYLGPRLSGFQRVGVRVGQDFGSRDCYVAPADFDPQNPLFALPGGGDPLTRVFTRGDWQPGPNQTPPPRALPGLLYRYQVANTLFPEVSTDIVQVTPLMERIAFRAENPLGGILTQCNGLRIYDPHIAVSPEPNPAAGTPVTYDIWLLDSMPVTLGARYAYLLVTFRADGEIRAVIPAGTVDIPLTP